MQVLDQAMTTTLDRLRSHFPTPEKVKISARSTLIVEGSVVIESLNLDGALVLTADPSSSISACYVISSIHSLDV